MVSVSEQDQSNSWTWSVNKLGEEMTGVQYHSVSNITHQIFHHTELNLKY